MVASFVLGVNFTTILYSFVYLFVIYLFVKV